MPRIYTKFLQIGEIKSSRILHFRETHQLGVPARADVDVLLDAYIDPTDLVGKSARLTFGYEGEENPHRFTGFVDSITILGTSQLGFMGRTYQYVVEVTSVLETLTRDFGCNVYQDLSTVDVLKKFLTDVGLPSDSFDFRTTGTYKPRDWCVRYQETALAYITRLCEHEGIYFFSETDDDGNEKLVFADDSTSAKAIDGDETLPYRRRSGTLDATDAITAIRERQRVVSGKYVLRDFDFEKPSLDLTQTVTADKNTDLEVYDYPGGYFDPAAGKQIVQARLDAEQAERQTLEIEASSPASPSVASSRSPSRARPTASTSSPTSATSSPRSTTARTPTAGPTRPTSTGSARASSRSRRSSASPASPRARSSRGRRRRWSSARRVAARGDPHRQARPLQGEVPLGSGPDIRRQGVGLDPHVAAADLRLDDAAAHRVGGGRRVPGGRSRPTHRHRPPLQRRLHAAVRAPRGQDAHRDQDRRARLAAVGDERDPHGGQGRRRRRS